LFSSVRVDNFEQLNSKFQNCRDLLFHYIVNLILPKGPVGSMS